MLLELLIYVLSLILIYVQKKAKEYCNSNIVAIALIIAGLENFYNSNKIFWVKCKMPENVSALLSINIFMRKF